MSSSAASASIVGSVAGVFPGVKVKECETCAQGFDEDNNPIGRNLGGCTGVKHTGPIKRISFGNLTLCK